MGLVKKKRDLEPRDKVKHEVSPLGLLRLAVGYACGNLVEDPSKRCCSPMRGGAAEI
jgi:hypothetical protein